jgi:hypothetical protein
VSRPPEFHELMDEIEQPDERERLQRVHDLLVQAGPPPELSPALASIAPPADAVPEEDERDVSWLPRRRLGATLVFVGAVIAATFGLGYLAGGSDSGGGETASSVRIENTAPMKSNGAASGVVNVVRRDASGNTPLIVTVRGLAPLAQGDYYILSLAKDGKPTVTCGTFNVASSKQQTLRMSAAYDLKGFDGWVVTRYDAKTHGETRVLWTTRA